jgi:hypothetical protein
MQGRIQGGPPPKIDFSHEIPQKFSRPPPFGAIFLSAHS